MIERLDVLQANKRQFSSNRELLSRIKADYNFRREIELLCKRYLDRSVQGCDSCYVDAYLELVNLNIRKMKEKEECLFRLRAGALLRDIKGNPKYRCSNANITNELVLYHLKTNPKCIELFEKYPKNYLELVEGKKKKPIKKQDKVQ